MNHITRQSAAFLAGAVAVVGLGFGGIALASDDKAPGPATQSEAAEPAVAGGDSIYLMECADDQLATQPSSFTAACGDANANLDSLEWSNWGAETATAAGALVVNDCDPDCASGSPESFPVEVTAGDLVKGEAIGTYGSLTLHFTGKVPGGFDQDEVLRMPTVEAFAG